MEWSGPAIRPGLDNRHLIIEGDKRSVSVTKCHNVWSKCAGANVPNVLNVLNVMARMC